MARITTSPTTRPGDRRQNDYLSATGMLAASATLFGTQSAMTSQTIYGGGIYLYGGEIVTNIIVMVGTAGAGTAPTNLKLGLWDSASTPNCVAVTADLAGDARWTTNAWKVNALSAPYTVPSDGLYYAAFWINGTFASTNLQLMTGNQLGPLLNQIGSAKRTMCTLKTSATTMAVSDTGTYGAGTIAPYLAVS